MPKFDERFARQYRYELPPGFPLASPNSGIDHHLSGLKNYAQAQTSWSAAVARDFTAVAFTSRMGLQPLHSHNSLTPWSVFQDGSCTHATINNLQEFNLTPRRREHFSTSRRCCRVGKKTSFQSRVMCTRFPFNDFRSVSSPFEVLFNFPSGYLFAIDLSPLFSHG